MQRKERKMYILICALLVLIGALMIFFNISYSPVKKHLAKISNSHKSSQKSFAASLLEKTISK